MSVDDISWLVAFKRTCIYVYNEIRCSVLIALVRLSRLSNDTPSRAATRPKINKFEASSQHMSKWWSSQDKDDKDRNDSSPPQLTRFKNTVTLPAASMVACSPRSCVTRPTMRTVWFWNELRYCALIRGDARSSAILPVDDRCSVAASSSVSRTKELSRRSRVPTCSAVACIAGCCWLLLVVAGCCWSPKRDLVISLVISVLRRAVARFNRYCTVKDPTANQGYRAIYVGTARLPLTLSLVTKVVSRRGHFTWGRVSHNIFQNPTFQSPITIGTHGATVARSTPDRKVRDVSAFRFSYR